MAEYIDRAVAKGSLRMNQHRFTCADEANGFGSVKWSEDVIYAGAAQKAIDTIPSADVTEVRHGKWEEGLCYDYYSKGVLESKCSICGSWNLFDFNGYNCESNFCPNCGADMRKDGGQ